MRNSEVRQRILDDHEEIRGVLQSIESLAGRVLDGDPGAAGPLRLEGDALHEQLFDHICWEDRHLAPALERAGSWGLERSRCLDRDHREQRELLSHTLSCLRDSSRPAIALATTMLDLAALLRADMRDEEEITLDERLLRYDWGRPPAGSPTQAR